MICNSYERLPSTVSIQTKKTLDKTGICTGKLSDIKVGTKLQLNDWSGMGKVSAKNTWQICNRLVRSNDIIYGQLRRISLGTLSYMTIFTSILSDYLCLCLNISHTLCYLLVFIFQYDRFRSQIEKEMDKKKTFTDDKTNSAS